MKIIAPTLMNYSSSSRYDNKKSVNNIKNDINVKDVKRQSFGANKPAGVVAYMLGPIQRLKTEQIVEQYAKKLMGLKVTLYPSMSRWRIEDLPHYKSCGTKPRFSSIDKAKEFIKEIGEEGFELAYKLCDAKDNTFVNDTYHNSADHREVTRFPDTQSIIKFVKAWKSLNQAQATKALECQKSAHYPQV